MYSDGFEEGLCLRDETKTPRDQQQRHSNRREATRSSLCGVAIHHVRVQVPQRAWSILGSAIAIICCAASDCGGWAYRGRAVWVQAATHGLQRIALRAAPGRDVHCGGAGCDAGAIRPAHRQSLVPQLAHPGVSRS